MSKVLLIRPNDFIANAMVALVGRAGLEALRIAAPADLLEIELREVVGAVVSTAVTSSMPMTFAEAVTSLRRRSQVPLVATTLLKDEKKATEFVVAELGGGSGLVPFAAHPTSLTHRALGTSSGLLVLRKDDVETPGLTTLELLRRHFHVRG